MQKSQLDFAVFLFLKLGFIVNYVQFRKYLVMAGEKIHGPITHVEHWCFYV